MNHTPGPWRWELNLKHKELTLCGGKPRFDLELLRFRRWGMNGAVAYFRNQFGLLESAVDFAKQVPGREHHAEWFQTLRHPDADLIAAAPDLLFALEALLRVTDLGDGNAMEFVVAEQAIRKARGGE